MKKNKIIFWISTALVAVVMTASAVMYLISNPMVLEQFAAYGYPSYFRYILGIAKILGAIALVLPRLKILNEWAYAGFAFTLIGAIWTHAAVSEPVWMPLFFMALLALSYIMRNKIYQA